MSEQEQSRKLPTETRIADGVLHVIATRGFDVVSVRTVAEACMVSAGTVQYHFPTRRALLTAGLIRSLARQQAAIYGEGKNLLSFDSLFLTLRQLLPLKEALHEDAVAWVSFVAAAGSRPWLAEIVREASLALQDYIAGQIANPESDFYPAPGLSPEQAARLITSVLNGLTIDLLAAPENGKSAIGDLESGLKLILKCD